MAKDYNIDDILSEVKQRRAEQESNLKSAPAPKAAPVQTDANREAYAGKLVEELLGPEKPAVKPEPKEKKTAAPQPPKAAPQPTPAPREKAEPQQKAAPAPEAKRAPKPAAPKADTADVPVQQVRRKLQPPPPAYENRDRTVTPDKPTQKPENQPPLEPANLSHQATDEMIDLFSLSGKAENAPAAADKKRKSGKKQKGGKKQKDPNALPWRKTKKGKISIAIIVVLAVLIVAGGVFAVCYVNGLLGKFTDEADDYKKTDTSYHGMDFLKENFPEIKEPSAADATTYKEYLKNWYQNGDPVSSTHVKNILLIGEDTREEQISDTSRADSAIIASVNIDTGKITLTSVLRDLYVYFEANGEGQYDKINGAASMGGMKEYIKTVERYYKIQIDNYAVVNFASFPKIIDSLGGVTITITDREINEINNHPKRYGNVYIEKSYEGTEGKQKLNGKQALAYCRIRKIDTDNARADRQKTVLLQVFKKMKGSSTTELLKVVNDLVGYVYTGYSKKELVSLATYALSNGWMNYETQTFSVPTPDHARGGNYLIGPTQLTPCGPSRGVWLWKSDIPQDAYDLQMKIYGKSNIKLAENRCDYCNLL